MTFAGALQITDLDDFLTPSQACIIPVRGSKAPAASGDGKTEIVIDADNNYYEVSTYPTAKSGNAGGVGVAAGGVEVEVAGRQALKKAEISLNDCLACSGCITSTESLLITMQSHNEVLEFINAQDFCRAPILSIAPQTLASLSASYAAAHQSAPIPLLVLLRRIRHFLAAPERGGWKVWDTTFARHVSLRETVREFAQRRQAGPLPVLASACPGWVCYAEKAQGDLLPLLSSARSSQGIMGALAKQYWASSNDRTPDKVYHVTAMPCYDKKLEASRQDFYSDVYKTRDTDCVLTTGELDLLLAELGFDPMAETPDETAAPTCSSAIDPTSAVPFPELLQHPGSSSGSYLATLMSALAAAHPGPTRIYSRLIRGSTDNVEYFLESESDGTVLFKGSRVYGFRNLQNMVRKVGKESGLGRVGPRGAGAGKLSAAVAARRRKARTAAGEIATPGSSTPGTPSLDSAASVDLASAALAAARDAKKLDFIEVMACPGGCVNGGGQMKPASDASANGVSATSDASTATATVNANGIPVDAEGYPRPLPDDGVAPAPLPTNAGLAGADEGMRWSTKEWVATVENVYWSALPTPPASPVLAPVDGVRSAAVAPQRTAQADAVARQVEAVLLQQDGTSLVAAFAKVEGDVLSQGGLTHEQVRW